MITIIIVNWNSGQYLRQCIESISLISGQFINKIIIVDILYILLYKISALAKHYVALHLDPFARVQTLLIYF